MVAWADVVLTFGTDFDTATTVLQAWNADTGNASVPTQVAAAALKGYRVIDSASSYLYLDCGLGNFVTGGNSWCDPYKTWFKIYVHDPILGKPFEVPEY